VRGGDALDRGFSVLVGLAGSGDVGGEPFGRGVALLIPFAAGELTVSGDVEGLRCRPPAP
jgi:mannose-6-phosphate isomerase